MTVRRWLLVILVVGGLLRVFPYWFGLPYLEARPDESVAIGIALGMLRTGDANPHFFHWPSLALYLFAGVFWTAQTLRRLWTDVPFAPADYHVIGRLVVATAGTATLAVLFAIGRRIAGATVGLIAAALLAVAILHVRESHFAMTDVLMTFFVTSSLAVLLGAYDAAVAGQSTLRGFAVAGLLAGLAASTKYNAAAVGGAMLAVQLLLLARSRRVAALSPLLAYSALFGVGFLAASPYAVLDFAKFREDVFFDFQHLSEGHGIDLGRGWVYHLMRSLPFGLGPLTFVAALVGLAPFASRFPRHAFIVAAFVVPFYVSIGSGYTVFFRYILPIVPVLCLSAAVGVWWAAARLRRRTAMPALLVIVIGASLVNSVWFDVLLTRTDTRVLAAQWLGRELRRDHTLHDAGGRYTRLDLTGVVFHQWNFDSSSNSSGDPEARPPNWIVMYESPLSRYTRPPWRPRYLAATRYSLAHSVVATNGRPGGAVYDPQDAFFMPVWGMWTVERPGPTVLIYRQRE